MFTINRTEITGNITKPAKTTQAGETTVTKARIVHDETIKRSGDQDPLELITAIEIELWGRSGQHFEAFVTPKTPVYIQGSLQLHEWEQDGERRFKLYIRVTSWQFILPKSLNNQRNAVA